MSEDLTFAALVRRELASEQTGRAPGPNRPPPPGRWSAGAASRAAELLAHLAYPAEIGLKNRALAAFWRVHRLPGKPDPVVPSPLARHYRTTTKRRAVFSGGKLRLAFAEDEGEAPGPRRPALQGSVLEPPEHAAIYEFLLDSLQRPGGRAVAGHLNYLIVRGSYSEFTVIVNVDRLDAGIVRALVSLGERLRSFERKVVSAFIFHDPTGSPYYLDHRRTPGGVKLKKLFGPDRIVVDHGGRRYAFPPTGFSQINGAMVPALVEGVRELLSPRPEQLLIDLYCGYGLFAHALAGRYARVIGLDAAPLSIAAARDNSAWHGTSARVEFYARRITAQALAATLPRAGRQSEAILLDPPRQGPERGVIAALAARRPAIAVEAFCGVDELPRQVREWEAGAYRVGRIVPLDMFPGTASLEVLVSLLPAR